MTSDEVLLKLKQHLYQKRDEEVDGSNEWWIYSDLISFIFNLEEGGN